MYSSQHQPVSMPIPTTAVGNSIMDGSGTINPAALNTQVAVLPSPAPLVSSKTSARGLKRSRSPEVYGDAATSGTVDDDDKPRKRGRPTKSRTSGSGLDDSSAQSPQQVGGQTPVQLQTPQSQSKGLPQGNTPPPSKQTSTHQTSPPKATPTKTVVKALPTVRDHTTDQLSADGDEYIPREYDEAGEKKVSETGRLVNGREYKGRTFLVPNRGDKLFMLATECARILGYRDSYLLFNKNRSLYKIIATQPEKDDLIHQDILPYSYRSRQIAIVTAKSMFRQFGSRVVINGRRVRDDYWESKARKQGFTEEDMAGEKRPGGAKAAREAQAAEAAQNAAVLGHQQDNIIYNTADMHGSVQFMQPAPLPMIQSDDMRSRDYSLIPRPRQEITGTPFIDRSQPSSMAEIMSQAAQTTDFSRILNQQQKQRGTQLKEHWEREIPVSSPAQPPADIAASTGQPTPSHQLAGGGMVGGMQPSMLPPHPNAQMIPQPSYPPVRQTSAAAQSPVMRSMQQIRQNPVQQPQRPSSSYSQQGMPQSPAYPYGQSSQQMWGQPPPQPQQSPMLSHHSMPHYSPQLSSHAGPNPHASSQSPHQHQMSQPPQIQPQHSHSQSSGSMHGSPMGYMPQPGYGGMSMGGRNVYQQPGQNAHYMQQTAAQGAAGLQGWAPPPQPGQGPQQGWQGYQ